MKKYAHTPSSIESAIKVLCFVAFLKNPLLKIAPVAKPQLKTLVIFKIGTDV